MSLKENWELKIRNEVYKDTSSFPEEDRERIINTIESLPLNPFIGDVQKMKGEENVWRRRVGVYRIFYELIFKTKVIYVFRVERRTSKTY